MKGIRRVCTFKQMADDGQRVMHANLAMFGEVMLHDEFPEHGAFRACDAAHVAITSIYRSAEVDAALARGEGRAAVIYGPDDVFWGARYG